MEHSRKQKLLVVLALVVAIASLSIGFAAFSTTLNISSSASVTPNSDSFSVKFSRSADELDENDIGVSSLSDGVTAIDATISNMSNPKLNDIYVLFNKPGQYAEYKFYIRNEGEYTAYFNTINFVGKKVCMAEIGTSEELVKNACDFINMNVTIGDYSYNTGSPAQGVTVLDVGQGIEARVRIEYLASGPSVDGPFSITFPSVSIVYSSVDDYTLDSARPTVIRLDSGDLNTPGSIVSIGNEQFYVIGQENGNVKLLSMYNLHVGKKLTHYDGDDAVLITIANPTGIQDSSAKGYNYDKDSNEELYPFVGLTVFSNNSSTYSGSIVEGYVNSYKTYLTNIGVEISSARLITKTELEGLGCSSDDYSCSSAPSWIYSTSYWSGTADNDESGVWAVFFDNFFDAPDYNYDLELGIRPVIEIPLSEFE